MPTEYEVHQNVRCTPCQTITRCIKVTRFMGKPGASFVCALCALRLMVKPEDMQQPQKKKPRPLTWPRL